MHVLTHYFTMLYLFVHCICCRSACKFMHNVIDMHILKERLLLCSTNQYEVFENIFGWNKTTNLGNHLYSMCAL